MSSAVKIGVLGGGYGAKVALPAYGALEQFEPVAVWSRRAERAQELAGEAGGAALGGPRASRGASVTRPGSLAPRFVRDGLDQWIRIN